MGLAGVILAAGESTRMGRDKALLPWPPQHTVTAGDAHVGPDALVRAGEGSRPYAKILLPIEFHSKVKR